MSLSYRIQTPEDVTYFSKFIHKYNRIVKKHQTKSILTSFILQYADLDEFLSENNIPDGLPGTHLGHSTGLGHRNDSLGHSTGLALGLGHITTKRERSPSPSDCVSPDTINPPSPAESSEY